MSEVKSSPLRTSMFQSMMGIPFGSQIYDPPVVSVPLGRLTLGPAEKYTDGRGSYWRYPIFVEEQLKSYRRYSEFEWLRNELISLYPGCCIPALPEKEGLDAYWSTHGEEFLRYRRHGLESFLGFCSLHPLLKPTSPFKDFIEFDELRFAMRTKETSVNEGYLSRLTNYGSSLVNTVTKYIYGSFEGIALNDEDQELTAEMNSVISLRARSEQLCEEASNLILKMTAEAESNSALAKAYENLARVESEGLAKQLNILSEGHYKIARFVNETRREMSSLFGEELEDSLRITQGALEAFERRQRYVENVLQEKAAISKQGYVEAEIISERLRQYEKALAEISVQLQSDLKNFQELRNKVIENVSAEYVKQQLVLAANIEEVWREVHASVCN